MNMKEKRQWAKKLIKGIKATEAKSAKNIRSTPTYWNGDDWGSIQGVKDAAEWVENQLIDYILENAKPN